MSLTGEQQDQTGRGQRSRADDQWVRVRYALIVGWLLVIVATGMLGERSGSWVNVQGQVASGEVGTIRVSGALPADATGYATVDVHWRLGLWRYVARVVEVHGPGAPSNETLLEGAGVSAVVHTDPGVRLSRSHPGLRVLRDSQNGSDSSLLGWRVPNWLGLVAFTLILGGLASLVAGPQPWRATRWAWFWLLLPPVGSIAFVLFSGPTPLLPTPRDKGCSRETSTRFAKKMGESPPADSLLCSSRTAARRCGCSGFGRFCPQAERGRPGPACECRHGSP